jgi:hypothetical protein
VFLLTEKLRDFMWIDDRSTNDGSFENCKHLIHQSTYSVSFVYPQPSRHQSDDNPDSQNSAGDDKHHNNNNSSKPRQISLEFLRAPESHLIWIQVNQQFQNWFFNTLI